MKPQSVEELAERLLAAERSLEIARAELSSLRGSARQGKGIRLAGICLGIALIFGTAAFDRLSVTHAAEGQTITAPFTVVSKTGQKLLRVEDSSGPNGKNAVILCDDSGQPIAGLLQGPDGGIVMATAPGGGTRASMGVEHGGTGGLAIFDNEQHRIFDVSRGPNGGQGLGIYDKTGKLKIEAFATANDAAQVSLKSSGSENVVSLLAGDGNSFIDIRESKSKPIALLGLEAGAGAEGGGPAQSIATGLTIYGKGGNPIVEAKQNPSGDGSVVARDSDDQKTGVVMGLGEMHSPGIWMLKGGNFHAALAVVDGKPALNLSSDSGAAIVNLSQDPHGYGYLELGNGSGTALVEAGGTDDGRGAVRAFPFRGGGNLMGLLPGTYIMGRSHQ